VLLGLAVGLVLLPAVAVSETTPTIEAVNGPGYYGEPHAWKPAQETVTAGGAVTFSNPTGTSHGVEWLSPPATPSCTGNIPGLTSPSASGPNWSGTCTFSKAGTYNFRCTVHPEMTGTITVNPNGTTTTTTTTPAPGGGGSGPPSSTTNPGSGSPPVSGTSGSPPVASLLTAVSLAARQHGSSVRGSLVVSQAGAGGRLEVALLARSASLAKAGRPQQVRVGRLVRASLRAGKVSFTVPLGAKAKHALRLHRRLALTVAIVLTPAHGAGVTLTRSVVVTS
jgi:plastocyanin